MPTTIAGPSFASVLGFDSPLGAACDPARSAAPFASLSSPATVASASARALCDPRELALALSLFTASHTCSASELFPLPGMPHIATRYRSPGGRLIRMRRAGGHEANGYRSAWGDTEAHRVVRRGAEGWPQTATHLSSFVRRCEASSLTCCSIAWCGVCRGNGGAPRCSMLPHMTTSSSLARKRIHLSGDSGPRDENPRHWSSLRQPRQLRSHLRSDPQTEQI